MFMVLKKKKIYTFIAIIFFVVVFMLVIKHTSFKPTKNVSYDNEIVLPQSGDAVLTSNTLTDTNEYKIEEIKNDRDVIRSKSLEILNSVIDNPNTSNESKKEAEKELINTASYIKTESDCEKLLMSKGYGDCVVFITDNLITVSLSKQDIQNTDIVVINDIIYSQSGNNNIKIVEVV